MLPRVGFELGTSLAPELYLPYVRVLVPLGPEVSELECGREDMSNDGKNGEGRVGELVQVLLPMLSLPITLNILNNSSKVMKCSGLEFLQKLCEVAK